MNKHLNVALVVGCCPGFRGAIAHVLLNLDGGWSTGLVTNGE